MRASDRQASWDGTAAHGRGAQIVRASVGRQRGPRRRVRGGRCDGGQRRRGDPRRAPRRSVETIFSAQACREAVAPACAVEWKSERQSAPGESRVTSNPAFRRRGMVCLRGPPLEPPRAQPRFGERLDQAPRPQARVRQHRDATGVADSRERLEELERGAHGRAPAAPGVLLGTQLDVIHVSRAHERLRHVRAAHHARPARRTRPPRKPGDAEVREASDDGRASGARSSRNFARRSRSIADRRYDEITEDVQVLPFEKSQEDLDAGHELEPIGRPAAGERAGRLPRPNPGRSRPTRRASRSDMRDPQLLRREAPSR